MTDLSLPSDIGERQAALDPAESFLVQAPAGSGKTSLLIQRMLVLLAEVEAPEEITAITFTRKAAAEMRARLIGALADARAGKQPANPAETTTLQLAHAVLARDAQRGWSLLENSGRLRIMTFDSLCSTLVRDMAAAGTGRMPSTLEDASPLYLEAARTTLGLLDEGTAEESQAIRALLRHLDNHAGTAERLIASMLSTRDQWLRLAVHDGRPDRARLEASLAAVRAEGFERAHSEAQARGDDALWRLASEAAARAAQAGTDVPDALFGLTQLPLPRDESAWLGLASAWLTAEGAWRKRFTAKEGYAPPSGAKDKEIKEQLTQQKAAAEGFVAAVSPNTALREALNDLRSLPPAHYLDEQWEALDAILNALVLAVARLKVIFAARGEADFSEVAQLAIWALESERGVTDIAVDVDAATRHLLVDEFQDTSYTQFRLLSLLTREWTGDGRTLFLVGDPMQSIYRFREADVGLFLRTRATGISGVRPQSLLLSANFRSQAGIVDWINGSFDQVMPATEDVTAGAVSFSMATAARPVLPGNPVVIHGFVRSETSATEEAQATVGAVREAWAQDASQSVAILVRSRGHLAEITPALRAAGIPYAALEIDPLSERAVPRDLFALTCALEHAADRSAWLAVLRAPWCGMTLADLHRLCNESAAPVPALLADPARIAGLSPDGQARARRAAATLLPLLAERALVPMHQLLERAWLSMGGPAAYPAARDQRDCLAWIDLVAEMEEEGGVLPASKLEEQLSALYALPAPVPGNAVQIMTIHRAKGLEFDVVILPGLERRPRQADRRLMTWAERVAADGGTDLLLAPVRDAAATEDAISRYIARLDEQRANFEAGRLLYVAATRAKKRLHLMGAVTEKDGEIAVPSNSSLLGQLWPAVSPYFSHLKAMPVEDAPSVVVAPAAAPSRGLAIRRLPSGWRLPSLPAPVAWTPLEQHVDERDAPEFSWAGETARHVGTIAHRWLHKIALMPELPMAAAVDGWDEALGHALLQAGVPLPDRPAALARVKAALRHCLTDAHIRWILGPREHARSEWRLNVHMDGQVREIAIDRAFKHAGDFWVADFKMSVHAGTDVAAFLDREEERYRPQLDRYASTVNRLEPGVPVKRVLLFPLLKGWRAWDDRGVAVALPEIAKPSSSGRVRP